MQNAPWFNALLKDERFVAKVVERYRELRKGVLSDAYLVGYIDDTVAWLGNAIGRNYAVWGYAFNLDRYNGMNYLTPPERNATTYEEAIDQLKDFLVARGAWLDAHIESLYQNCHESKIVNELIR